MQPKGVVDTMTTQFEPGRGRPDPSLNAIMSERRQLINLAYRLLGSLADAEDVVQETYARWYAMTPQQQDDIQSPGGWLMKVASRICLDLLGSARARRENYVGAWIPPPHPRVPGSRDPDGPARRHREEVQAGLGGQGHRRPDRPPGPRRHHDRRRRRPGQREAEPGRGGREAGAGAGQPRPQGAHPDAPGADGQRSA